MAKKRITVLMTASEKASLERRARAAGVSVGEFVRRSVERRDPDEEESLRELVALAQELDRSNRETSLALDRALASIEATHAQLHPNDAAA